MSINAISTQMLWQQQHSARKTAASGFSVPQDAAPAAARNTAKSGQSLPAQSAQIAAQEVDSSKEGQSWLKSVIAEFRAEAEARSAATANRAMERLDVEKLRAEGKITSLWEPNIGPEPTPVPDEVDGVETGFLNSRYITMPMLSRAEDLIENHPDVAKQVFNLDDPMHRSLLYSIDRHDFDDARDAASYQNAIGQQFYEAGMALTSRPGGGAPGTKMQYLIDSSVSFLGTNPFIRRTEEAVEGAHEHSTTLTRQQQQEKALLSQLEASTSPQQEYKLYTRLQDLRAEMLNSKNALREYLQEFRDLEHSGIDYDTMQDAFAQVSESRYGKEMSLTALNEQADVTAATPRAERPISGFDKWINAMLEQQAPVRERYNV